MIGEIVEAPRSLDEVELTRLRERFAGTLIHPRDEGYEEARRVWNGSIDRYPALIARCSGTADVIAAMRFAQEQELLVAVRGGGHNIAGNGTCDGGMVIDLSPMKGVWVEPQARRARAQAGLVWRELDRETQAFGLAVTGGLVSSTGVAGFTLGGGLGWLVRRCGLTIDSLESADVVLADGRFVRASREEHDDLFWGLRGGGGNFGIVTSFEFALHHVGPQVVAGLVVHRAHDLQEVARFYREFVAEASEDITLALILRKAPAAPFLPPEVHGEPVVIVAGCCAGPVADGLEAMRSVKAFGRPIVDLMQPRLYTEFQSMLDASWLPGFQNYWKAEFIQDLPPAAVEVFAEHLDQITSPMSDVKFLSIGGAVSKVSERETAYGHRHVPFVFNINARWADPRDGERHIAWTRRFWQAMRPYSAGGVYVNFLGDEGAERIRSAYGEEKYARLRALKAKYDPTNFFRLNQNIKPTR